MSKKRACTFNDDLQKEFKFLKRESLSEASKLRCDICGARFSIAHGGRADITQHMHTKKHMDAAKSKCATPSVSEFFVKQSCESDKVHASEGLFAYHSVIHGHSFRSADCTAKLIKKLYDPKFSSARTKSEAIICNVLCPLSEEEVQHDLDKCSFVTLTVDASNHKDIKLFPVLVRYFKPLEGVKVKIIEFSSLPGETSDLQTAYISHVIEKHGLAQKIVALCADNTNTNFGGVKRAGKGNIWRKLQIQLGRDILGIGCNAHIIHNTLQTAVDCLPIDLECFAVKVYKYFHIYTVRVKELKEFCDFVQLDYQKLLQHGSTRFLSLGPSLERILHLFDGLRAYFLSQEKCPKFLKDTFSNPCTKLWLGFALKQTAAFHRALETVEQDNISATEVALHIYDLRNVLAGGIIYSL